MSSWLVIIIVLNKRIIVAAIEVEKERSRRLGTSILNQVVREAVTFKPPPRTRGGKRGRVYYCTQVFIPFDGSAYAWVPLVELYALMNYIIYNYLVSCMFLVPY